MNAATRSSGTKSKRGNCSTSRRRVALDTLTGIHVSHLSRWSSLFHRERNVRRFRGRGAIKRLLRRYLEQSQSSSAQTPDWGSTRNRSGAKGRSRARAYDAGHGWDGSDRSMSVAAEGSERGSIEYVEGVLSDSRQKTTIHQSRYEPHENATGTDSTRKSDVSRCERRA